jgi:alkylhydroperoxidase family enzyme
MQSDIQLLAENEHTVVSFFVRNELRAVLGFLKRMTQTPGVLSAQDAQDVFRAGVCRDALEQAVLVAYLFNIINRVADALGFHVPSDAAFRKDARILLRMGYNL